MKTNLIVLLLIFYFLLSACEPRSDQKLNSNIEPTYGTETIQGVKTVAHRSVSKLMPSDSESEKWFKALENGHLYQTDSSIRLFLVKEKKDTLVLSIHSGFKAVQVAHHWKLGLVTLVKDEIISYVLNLKTNQSIDTIAARRRTDGESSSAIQKFYLSPTGEYVALDIRFYEDYGTHIIDIKSRKRVEEAPYISNFIKWSEGNKFIAINDWGHDLGDLIVHHYNLDNHQSIEIKSPWTKYVSHTEEPGHLFILGEVIEPNSTKDTILKIRPEKQLSTLETQEKPIHSYDSITASFENHRNGKFRLQVTNHLTKDTLLNRLYAYEYPHLSDFKFSKIRAGADHNIRLWFDVNFRHIPYGQVCYELDLEGNIQSKSHINEITAYEGQDVINYETHSDSSSNIVQKFVNGQLEKEDHLPVLLPPIPKSISYHPL